MISGSLTERREGAVFEQNSDVDKIGFSTHSDSRPRHILFVTSAPLSQELSGHRDVVLGVSTHPKLPIFASGGTDKDLCNIRIWMDEAKKSPANPAPEAPTIASHTTQEEEARDAEAPASKVARLE